MDSILGALALGDISKHFPDTDMKYKDINSMILLENVYGIMTENGYEVAILMQQLPQKPRLAPYINEMRKNISETRTSIDNISIKATTTENLASKEDKRYLPCVCY